MNITKRKYFVLLFVISSCVLISGCNAHNKEAEKMIDIDQVTASEWKAFTQRHLVFGHQSVGHNILSGVQSLAETAGIKLQVTKSRSSSNNYGITHFEIGQNVDPNSKITDFEDTLTSGKIHGVDIAMMKLCYVDINYDTDAKKLAENYSAALDRLSIKFPNTTFVAVTIPLTTLQSGPKAWIKRIMGKTPSGYVENYRRLEFNEILRDKFERQGRLFDLAKFEAAGGSTYKYQGHAVEMMNPALTSDGGHLNSIGERFIAAKMIKYVANLPASL